MSPTYPESLSINDGRYSSDNVDETKSEPSLTLTVQELSAEVETLKAKVETLEAS
jgi:outer membrane murein-binding lipoprotein Lpp